MTVDVPVLTSFGDIGDFIGDSLVSPAQLILAIQLTPTNWAGILSAIQTAGENVTLDLTLCQGSSGAGAGLSATGVFDPDSANTIGKTFISTLILPDAATSIIGATTGMPTFDHFANLSTIEARFVTDVGDFAFVGCPLQSVNLPRAIMIGDNAFESCTSLANLNILAITTFGERVFQSTGTQTLAITMGYTAPSVGPETFAMVPGKIITVNVPAGATSYGVLPVSIIGPHDPPPNEWGYGFRSRGWDASATPSILTGLDNEFITLVIQALP